MSRPATPHPPSESDSEVGFIVLAALSWLERLDASLPPAGEAARREPLDALEAALLGSLSLTTRLCDCFDEHLAEPTARPEPEISASRSRSGWLR